MDVYESLRSLLFHLSPLPPHPPLMITRPVVQAWPCLTRVPRPIAGQHHVASEWGSSSRYVTQTPQWAAADAEIKVPSGENTELKRSPFKTWSRSVHSHSCYAYCQGFLPCLFLPFRSIRLDFFLKLLPIFPVLAVANTWFLCRPAE